MKGTPGLMLVGIMLCFGSAWSAASGPEPPCGRAPLPAYPEVDAPPVTHVWNSMEWTPPPCTGWGPASSSTLVATVGRFRSAAGIDEMRGRIGAVSRMSGMLYWSTTHKQWRTLIVRARALSGAGGPERHDFTAEDVAEGRSLYLQQEDSLFGTSTYRLRIASVSALRLVFASENSASVKYYGIPVLGPSEVQAIYFLDREPTGVWRYYSIGRIGKAASLLTSGHEASLVNRAVASYRFLAGIPLDREPPAAR